MKAKWFNVETDLPEYDVDVLLYAAQTPYIIKIGRRDHTDKDGEHWIVGTGIERAITHWTHLPDTPEYDEAE